jgi:hypothetical protein
MNFFENLKHILPIYKLNPSFKDKNIALFATFLLASGITFALLNFLNNEVVRGKDSKISSLEAGIKLRDDKLSDKFQNISRDEGKDIIRIIQERLDKIETNSKINPPLSSHQSYQNSFIPLPYSGNWQNIDEPSYQWCYSGIRDPNAFNLILRSSNGSHKIFIGYDANSTCKNLASHLSNLFEKKDGMQLLMYLTKKIINFGLE